LLAVGIDPDAFIGRAYVEAVSALCMGIAFVYVGAKVSPTHRKQTSLALAGLGLLVVGISMTFGMMRTNYWAVWADVFAGLGAGGAAFAINRGEINLT